MKRLRWELLIRKDVAQTERMLKENNILVIVSAFIKWHHYLLVNDFCIITCDVVRMRR